MEEGRRESWKLKKKKKSGVSGNVDFLKLFKELLMYSSDICQIVLS